MQILAAIPHAPSLQLIRLLRRDLLIQIHLSSMQSQGTSGAGRGAKTPNLFCEVNESMKAYGVASHRHTPEIEEQLGYAAGKEILINFTPHLVPMNRGISLQSMRHLRKSLTEHFLHMMRLRQFTISIMQMRVCQSAQKGCLP